MYIYIESDDDIEIDCEHGLESREATTIHSVWLLDLIKLLWWDYRKAATDIAFFSLDLFIQIDRYTYLFCIFNVNRINKITF